MSTSLSHLQSRLLGIDAVMLQLDLGRKGHEHEQILKTLHVFVEEVNGVRFHQTAVYRIGGTGKLKLHPVTLYYEFNRLK